MLVIINVWENSISSLKLSLSSLQVSLRNKLLIKTYFWAYVDGVAQGWPRFRGAGDLIYSINDHWFSFAARMGEYFNNCVEFTSIKLLLTFFLSLSGFYTYKYLVIPIS